MTMPLYLIAEYCPGPFYMGWHLYVRDSKGRQQRNADGEWGWIRYSPSQLDWDRRHGESLHPARHVFRSLGIFGEIAGGDGDDGTIAGFAFAFPIPRQRIGKKPRGCVEIEKGEYGELRLTI